MWWLSRLISSATVGLAGAGVALHGTRRTAKTAQEGRAEQRAADGYLKIVSLAEQEAQWLDAQVFHFGLDEPDDAWGFVKRDVSKPAMTDRATAAALPAAFASASVQEAHSGFARWTRRGSW
jgi:hypothetical protein